ncbi:hypothetical protein [Arcticibacter pallidicorallinus]|uniref:hypothetical protein n=1 Tax=Arcticibacter pallidicorallinus TaxID=1259464 RepID=UPI000D05E27E|nr:hypothetical protein [Arcticibacter pallidicorallinus]
MKKKSPLRGGMKLFEVPAPGRISFYDLQIAAGDFSALQQAERVRYIEVEDRYSRSKRRRIYVRDKSNPANWI